MECDSAFQSPQADLGVLNWLVGHWRGEAFGGITEEIWSPALGGSMMCSFKVIIDNTVRFYELVTIAEENESLVMRLRHFNRDLKGWEDKTGKPLTSKLIRTTGNRIYFDGFTFEKVNQNEINIYAILQQQDKKEEVKFNLKRVR